MHRIFGHSKKTTTASAAAPTAMDPKKLRRKPKLERRNALKYFDYDAGSSSSSLDDSSSSGSLYTRSMELHDRTSFRIEGIEGEFDRICQSLGLSGPEDFAIPAAAWEAMKVRSSSDILPRLKLSDLDLREKEEPKVVEEGGGLSGGCEEVVMVRVRDDEAAVTSGCCGESGGGGINGVRPPMLKPPPGMRVSVVDNSTCSTWDLLRDLAPEGGRIFGDERGGVAEKEGEGEGEVGRVSPKREEEEGVVSAERIEEIVAGLSESCSFTTSNEDDSSSTATDPRSNNVSPNGRIKRVIAPSCWQKGEFLGGGSFGSVYEGISE